VHVLVLQRQAVEIQRPRVGAVQCLQAGQGLLQLSGELGAQGVGIGQLQLPAAVVRHRARVIEPVVGVGLCGARIGVPAQVPLRVAADPVLLEPADMAQFPERRIELGVQRHLQPGQHGFERR
jgi:hypothetical protein